MNSDTEPIRVDEHGEWYSIKGMTAKTRYTPERVRQLTKLSEPPIIKNKKMGVVLFRLADGWKFSSIKGIKKIG